MKHIVLNTLTLLFIIGCAGTNTMGETAKGNMDENISPSERIGLTPTAIPTVTPTAIPTVTPTPIPTVTPTPIPTVTPTPIPTVTPTPNEKMETLSEEIEIFLNPKTQDIDKAYGKLKEITDLCGDKQNHICAISYKNKGKIEKLKGQYSKAIMSYENAIKYGLEDNNGNLLEKIANIYYVNLKDINNSIINLKKLTKNNNRTEDSKIYYDIGALYIEQGKDESINAKKDILKSYAKKYILKSKQLGNRDAEHLWYKYELYKY